MTQEDSPRLSANFAILVSCFQVKIAPRWHHSIVEIQRSHIRSYHFHSSVLPSPSQSSTFCFHHHSSYTARKCSQYSLLLPCMSCSLHGSLDLWIILLLFTYSHISFSLSSYNHHVIDLLQLPSKQTKRFWMLWEMMCTLLLSRVCPSLPFPVLLHMTVSLILWPVWTL